MIRILILEDEIPARKKLRRFLDALNTPVTVIAEIDTVSAGIAFLKNHTADVILSDIELLDGKVFEIYQEVAISCPIIFITAYDRYWMDAFDSNGIAYLLKPYTQERFQKAWDKFMLLRQTPADAGQLLDSLTKMIQQNQPPKAFKKRFSIHAQQGIYFLGTDNISFFEATGGVVFAHDITGKKHLLNEQTLKEIEEQLDPSVFFRINRSELVHKPCVEKIEYCSKNVLSVKMTGHQQHLITSQNNTASFRHWVEQ